LKSIEELPNDLVKAIQHATRVNGWQENLGSDEIPPEWMWPFEDRLTEWFEHVEAVREEKYGGGDGTESVPMMSNQLAREDD
jgi:hypothetical protein